VTTRDLATDLDLDRLARRIPCGTGLDDCRCDGCAAGAALRLADEHLAAGRLLDASLKTGQAAYLASDPEVALAAARLENALRAEVSR
jgi:hypothetical protein